MYFLCVMHHELQIKKCRFRNSICDQVKGKLWNALGILWVVGVIAKSHNDMSKKLWDLWGTNLGVIVLEEKTCNCGRAMREKIRFWREVWAWVENLYWWQIWGHCFPFLVQFFEKFGWCNFIHLTYFGEQFHMRLGFFEIFGICHKNNQLIHENKIRKCWSLKAHSINFLCLLSKVMTYIKFKCRSLSCIISQIEFGSLSFWWQLFQLSRYFLGFLLLPLDKWGLHHRIVRVFFNVG